MEVESDFRNLRAVGAQVVTRQCDVSERDQVAALIDEIRLNLPPRENQRTVRIYVQRRTEEIFLFVGILPISR